MMAVLLSVIDFAPVLLGFCIQRVQRRAGPITIDLCAAILECLQSLYQGGARLLHLPSIGLHFAPVVQGATEFQTAAELLKQSDGLAKATLCFLP
jgi:hypothetical protein